ncbi:ABC transporter substrate-binding protein [Lysinibacillus sphaericus]|uniref:ABC transporter substrate-binding protein n=1 Tax=Lysinibacillus sphaericus TaxID=1421 RepID=UPI001C5EBF02
MDINHHIFLWNQASIKVLDVRHKKMNKNESLQAYKLPASVFLFATRGSAAVRLNNIEYLFKQFQVIHSGKGIQLSLSLKEAEFEFYMIFYRATIPLPCAKSIIEKMEKSNPFQVQFSFLPNYPSSLFYQVKLMNQRWQQPEPIGRFHVKALFYQFTYSVLEQLHIQGVEVKQPELADQVIVYIQEHYAESIMLESLAENLNYSVPHLSSLFKKKTGYSPIEYLILTRIEKAEMMLIETDATVREIAESVGYKDSYYFSRLFKKYKDVSPAKYRKIALSQRTAQDYPYNVMELSIVGPQSQRYIGDNHYQYTKKGDLLMVKPTKTPMLASLFLCFTLLLSACGGGAIENSSTNGSTNTSITQSQEVQPKTKTIITGNGEVEIPENPQRIVITAESYAGYLLALGIKPVGMSQFGLRNRYFDGLVDGIENIGDDESLEKILELKPDLIITKTSSENIENLQKIAPTIAIKPKEKDFKEQFLEFGKIFGKEEVAEEWIANWDRKIAEYKPLIQEKVGTKTIAILGVGEKEIYAYGDKFGRGGEIMYGEFGLKAPNLIQQEAIDLKSGWVSFSLEKLPEFAGDYIFVEDNADFEKTTSSILWRDLPAIKNKRVFIMDEYDSFFSDPISLDKQLEFIVDSILEREK